MDDVQSAPDTANTDVPVVSDDSGSLAAHEAAHGAGIAAESDGESPITAERGANGQFKPRHRAASQRADTDDVAAINEQTKRIKTAEETLGKDIARKDGESERVYNLRRRAELLERQAAPAPEPPKPTAPPQPPIQSRPSQGIPQTFPSYDAFVAVQGNEEATYEDYADARSDWRFARARAAEREQEQRETAQRTAAERGAKHLERVTAAKTKYTDWDSVVTNEATVGPVLIDAILSSEHSAEIAYYLGKHPDIRHELNAETPDYSASAVSSMRRYLDSVVAPLVASQRTPPPSRTAAGTTGAALALAPPPAPRPPTPVRTGAVTTADEPPGDDSQSLAAHEKHFGRARR